MTETHDKRTEMHACDLISRQAAIDAVEGVTWYHQNKNGEMVHGANSDEHQAWYKAEDIYKAIESVPSAQQWIPCSERLPEEEKAYLVTFACEKVGMSSWHKDTLYNRGFDAYLTGITEDGEYEYFGVVAWMEKPEPWKGEQE